MTEICDDYAGWHGLNHIWSHCRGGEEACLSIELLAVESGYAYVGVDRSWADKQGMYIDVDSYIEYFEGDTRWRVYCDGTSTSQNAASIRICYEEGGNGDDGMKEGDTRNVNGVNVTLVSMVCTPVQQIVAKIEGLSKTVQIGMFAIFPGPVLGGLIYVGLKSIDVACDRAIVNMWGGFTEDEINEMDDRLKDYTRPDGSKPTADEIHDIKMGIVKNLNTTDPEFMALLNAWLNGDLTTTEFIDRVTEHVIEKTKTVIIREYYLSNFDITIPSIVMAGDIEISGTAPKPNQKLEIMIQKKYFGFDLWAKDTSLGEITSGDDYKYKTTVALEDFGAVTVYARVQKGWIEDLLDPLTTPKHTIYVLTWTVVLALVAALALAYDKKMKGKFIGVFKKRR